MKSSESESASDDPLTQREALRRNFVRANSAVAFILFALLALAVAAVVASFRAQRNQEVAEAASRERQAQLAASLRTQARAVRLSGQAGRRSDALSAIGKAVALAPSTELRAEAIACLALTDLTPEQQWTQMVNAVGFSFDNALKHCAISSDGRHISVLETKETLRGRDFDLAAVSGNSGNRSAGLVLSPTGRYLATRQYGGGVVAWEIASGRVACNYSPKEENVTGNPSFTRDEQWLYFGDARWGTNLMRADLVSGAVQQVPVRTGPSRSFVVHPEGKRVAVANRRLIEVWNPLTGAMDDQLQVASPVSALAWNGSLLAVGTTEGEVMLWNVDTGHVRPLIGHQATILKVLFSPDGEKVCIVGADGTSRLCEAGSGRPILTMEGFAAQFSPDGQRLGFYRHGAGLGIWRVSPSVGYQVLREKSPGRGEGWKSDLSSDGRWLALTDWDDLYVWDLKSARLPLIKHVANCHSIFWHPSRPILFLVTDGHIESRTVTSATPDSGAAVALGAPTKVALPAAGYPLIAALSRDARTLAFVDEDGIVRIGDLTEPGSFVSCKPQGNPTGPLGTGSATGAGRLAVSPDGKWVATVDMATNDAPHIFDARTGELVKVLPTATAAICFSPDGRWLGTCGLEQFAVWSVGNWSQLWGHQRSGLPSVIGGIAFSEDGSVVAVTKSLSEVGLFDRATGSEMAEFTPPDLPSNAGIRMSADGSTIAAPTLNSMIQVWDVREIRQELAGLGLDWGQTFEGQASQPLHRVFGWASPASAILLGLMCATPATIFALRALRRHRRILQRFVHSEAESRRRSRELEVARVELMHSQKMKALGTLAAGIAHDFNNLLSVIRMSNKLIARETKNNPEVAEEIANIEDAVQQGKSVVSSMLGYSRDESGDQNECDLGEVAEETVSLLSREFLSGVELTLALDRDTPRVRVGRGRIEQILLNLLVNASEAMKGQGKLEIAVHRLRAQSPDSLVLRPREDRALVELRVADSGPGIPADVLPRIFDPFFTTKTAGTKQGTGLGLSMVYNIAEQDGLGIAVESSSGHGSTFRILLPTLQAERTVRGNHMEGNGTATPVRRSPTSQKPTLANKIQI